ncbi:MAG: tRNA (cytidine(34)-2'-O)-methyltransferase [Phycisphaeraceae bacterium]|nr:tRNA (cytidine(34)-2'-O)-methyltransferase [Phycisphaerales bacterium]MCB9842258.1 tRNA (cytidine(34)-2'-O)-methyltransferase [Phycisphaeraceae bacterium]
MNAPLFHIVLHEPEIPNNTGNIGRTCIATGCALHLIHPLGFDTSVKALRRAGLDYWPRLAPTEHADWHAYSRAHPAARRWCFTTKASRPFWDADLKPGDHLVFGKETAGLPADILAAHADTLITLPMVPGERSLNLATAVCAAIYEGVRQSVARGDITLDSAGRIINP